MLALLVLVIDLLYLVGLLVPELLFESYYYWVDFLTGEVLLELLLLMMSDSGSISESQGWNGSILIFEFYWALEIDDLLYRPSAVEALWGLIKGHLKLLLTAKGAGVILVSESSLKGDPSRDFLPIRPDLLRASYDLFRVETEGCSSSCDYGRTLLLPKVCLWMLLSCSLLELLSCYDEFCKSVVGSTS